ncbi:hypothetical protein B0J14DRAFT_587260 [Halenospora varia]|nr:hypothetical protein B0J14DRAFT_587260 [Halenospora varia]
MTDGSVQGPDSILHDALRSDNGITGYLEQSEELQTQYQAAAELGETGIPDDVRYHYVALAGGQDHRLYELDGERSSQLMKGSCSKMGFILNEPEDI